MAGSPSPWAGLNESQDGGEQPKTSLLGGYLVKLKTEGHSGDGLLVSELLKDLQRESREKQLH